MELDITRFPRSHVTFKGDRSIDLADEVAKLRLVIAEMQHQKQIRPTTSFGFAMVGQGLVGHNVWDRPYDFTALVVGWGHYGDRYIANAVRKLRALLRTGTDTLELRTTRSDSFQDTVASQEPNGAFAWGDYPWGGAVSVNVGGINLRGAVSCFKEVEDDTVTRLILGQIGATLWKLRIPEMFDD